MTTHDTAPQRIPRRPLDDVDRALVELLAADGRMPNAELVVISGAAHGFMVEHASTFNRVLLEFLGRVTRAQRAAEVDLTTTAAAS